jgi:hypothetical protein
MDVVSYFRVAPDRHPKIGNGSTVFAFHAKGVAAIAATKIKARCGVYSFARPVTI